MFVSHIFADKTDLPDLPACLYQYVAGANGLFVRAARPGLEALIPVSLTREPVRGLAVVAPYVRLSSLVWRYMADRLFLDAWRQGNKEKLYYFKLNQSIVGAQRSNPWYVDTPKQIQSAGGVHPVDPFAAGTETVLEVHSHHGMAAFFSRTDDNEERGGFRLFAVVGRLTAKRPEIRCRVGIYGHFWEIPAGWVFDLPPYVKDTLDPEYEQEVVYEDILESA